MEDTSQKNLPKILVINSPLLFRLYETEFSRHFNFVKAYESPLPLPAFLAANSDISAMFATLKDPPITASSVLDYVPSLRCIVSSATGFDHIDLSECRRRGIVVANSAATSSMDSADFVVGLVLDVMRKVSCCDRFVKCGGWRGGGGEFPLGRRLTGKTVGIVGLGRIGSAVAKRLEAFNCRILYNSRNEKPLVPSQFYSDVCEMAAESNVLVICCSLSDQTRHMINKEVLTALGKDGIIVNIARGAIIDEKELVKSLLEGRIAGAGMDVFEHEPSVPQELLSMDNVVLAHNQAAFTEECFRNLFELVKGNFEAFFSNKPLLSPVV